MFLRVSTEGGRPRVVRGGRAANTGTQLVHPTLSCCRRSDVSLMISCCDSSVMKPNSGQVIMADIGGCNPVTIGYREPRSADSCLARARRRDRRWKWVKRIAVVVAVVFGCTFYALFLGNNSVRVTFQHGVTLPPSAGGFECSGWSGTPHMIGGVASVRFQVLTSELTAFLSQFRMDVDHTDEQPRWSGAPTSSGEIFGVSPSGHDRVKITWTTEGEVVVINLETDTN